MKRFSAREFTLLSLPVLLVALAGWWARRHPAAPPSAIAVRVAQTVAPRPLDVARGARVAARLKFEARPHDSAPATWKVGVRVRAGEHLLWNDVRGDIERPIALESRTFEGAWHEWNGAFDLQQVPASWGEITLEWDAALWHERRSWNRRWTDKARRRGRLILRRAGQKLAVPVVSRDSHLKLVQSQITPASSAAGKPILRLKFERDAASLRAYVTDVTADLEIDNPGYAHASIEGLSEKFEGLGRSRQFARVECRLDDFGGPIAPGATVKWSARFGDYWPLSGQLALEDTKSPKKPPKSRDKRAVATK